MLSSFFPRSAIAQLARRWPVGVLLLALAGAPVWGLAESPANAPKAAKPALTVQLATASNVTLPQRLEANGTVYAWQEAVLGAEVSGLRVAELHAAVGDRVRRGQRLASFATEAVQADLRLAQAALDEAQALAAQAQANGNRARSLQGSGAMSDQELQQLLTQEQTALARVASAQAQVAAQQLRLRQTELVAPDDGIVSARSASIGAVLAQGTEMFRLIRKGRLEWRGELTAAELELVRPGQLARISSPGGSVWLGRVRLAAPTLDASTRKGLVYVDISAPESKTATPLRPGQYLRGELTLGEGSALVVPQAAVVPRDGFHVVGVVGPDQRVSLRKVQLGRLVGAQQEVLAGIKAGERLVASGTAFLREGDTVQIAPASPAAPAPQTAASR